MSIFQTAYDTTVMQGYDQERINTSILKALINKDNVAKKYLVQAIYKGTSAVPFRHPFALIDNNKYSGMFIDVRTLIRNVEDNGSYTVSNNPEYDLLVNRAALNVKWLDNPKTLDISPSELASIYARWIASNITKRFSLDANSTAAIEILSMFFYRTLFIESVGFDKYFIEDSILFINNNTKYPVELVQSILSDIDSLINIRELTNLFYTKTNNQRLKGFNSGLLISVLGGTWFGQQRQELLAIALEHIPTFHSLILASIKENLYRKTGFNQTVESVLKSNKPRVQLALQNIIED